MCFDFFFMHKISLKINFIFHIYKMFSILTRILSESKIASHCFNMSKKSVQKKKMEQCLVIKKTLGASCQKSFHSVIAGS